MGRKNGHTSQMYSMGIKILLEAKNMAFAGGPNDMKRFSSRLTEAPHIKPVVGVFLFLNTLMPLSGRR